MCLSFDCSDLMPLQLCLKWRCHIVVTSVAHEFSGNRISNRRLGAPSFLVTLTCRPHSGCYCFESESRLYDFPHNPSSSPSGSSPGRRGDLRGDVAVPPLPVSVHRLAPGHHRFARRLPLLELWRYLVWHLLPLFLHLFVIWVGDLLLEMSPALADDI